MVQVLRLAPIPIYYAPSAFVCNDSGRKRGVNRAETHVLNSVHNEQHTRLAKIVNLSPYKVRQRVRTQFHSIGSAGAYYQHASIYW
jgi:hypothetical protein